MGLLIGQFAQELGRVCRQAWDYINDGLPWNTPKTVQAQLSQDYFITLRTMSIYFALVLGGIWLTRKCCESVLINSRRYRQATIDCLQIVQFAMCAFGEYEIFQSYGFVAFFISTLVNKTLSLLLNGRETNIYLVGEEYWNCRVTKYNAFLVIAAQFLGSVSSFSLSTILLRVVKSYTGMEWRDSECFLPGLLNLDVWPAAILIGVGTGYLLRLISLCIDDRNNLNHIYFFPFVNATFFTFTLYLIGIPGLDVALGTSRIPGCVGLKDPGLETRYFLIHLLPIFTGWWIHDLRNPSLSASTLISEWAIMTCKDFYEPEEKNFSEPEEKNFSEPKEKSFSEPEESDSLRRSPRKRTQTQRFESEPQETFRRRR